MERQKDLFGDLTAEIKYKNEDITDRGIQVFEETNNYILIEHRKTKVKQKKVILKLNVANLYEVIQTFKIDEEIPYNSLINALSIKLKLHLKEDKELQDFTDMFLSKYRAKYYFPILYYPLKILEYQGKIKHLQGKVVRLK